MQSHHIHEDRSHRIYFGHMSQDDTIPLHSRGPRSPDHFGTDVLGWYNPSSFSRTEARDHFTASAQGWYNPTATSLLPLLRKVFPNNTKLVSKVLELYPRPRICQHISVESSYCNIIIWTIIIYIFSMWILNYHHLYLQYVNTESIIICIFSIEILKASSFVYLVW